METSFLSEHSVEYVLVPKFYQILSQKFSTVIPIYFWATREGNKSSIESVECSWFYLTDGVGGYSVIDVDSGELVESCDSKGPLLDYHILEIIKQNYRTLKFEDITKRIRDAQKHDLISINWRFNFEAYKPVYFLCKI